MNLEKWLLDFNSYHDDFYYKQEDTFLSSVSTEFASTNYTLTFYDHICKKNHHVEVFISPSSGIHIQSISLLYSPTLLDSEWLRMSQLLVSFQMFLIEKVKKDPHLRIKFLLKEFYVLIPNYKLVNLDSYNAPSFKQLFERFASTSMMKLLSSLFVSAILSITGISLWFHSFFEWNRLVEIGIGFLFQTFFLLLGIETYQAVYHSLKERRILMKIVGNNKKKKVLE